MIDWEHIAELLTEKWYNEGKLPITRHDKEYNYIFPTYFTGFPNDTLRYARTIIWEEIKNPGVLRTQIEVNGQIDRDEALREIWHLLTEDEKTTIMSEILGANVRNK